MRHRRAGDCDLCQGQVMGVPWQGFPVKSAVYRVGAMKICPRHAVRVRRIARDAGVEFTPSKITKPHRGSLHI